MQERAALMPAGVYTDIRSTPACEYIRIYCATHT